MSYASRTPHLVPEGAYQTLRRAQELEAGGRRSSTWKLVNLIMILLEISN